MSAVLSPASCAVVAAVKNDNVLKVSYLMSTACAGALLVLEALDQQLDRLDLE